MSKYWSRIAAMMDGDDDSRDTADIVNVDGCDVGVLHGGSQTASDWKIAHEQYQTAINLPNESIAESNGNCETCGTYAEGLGNELCVKCWDYVVDHSSANAKHFPDAIQYKTIYNNR